MTDDELIDKAYKEIFNTDSIRYNLYEEDLQKFINMVREQDVKSGRIKKLFRLNTEAAKQNERSKVKAECIEAAKSCRREVYSRAGVHKCYDMDISFNQLIKALEEV